MYSASVIACISWVYILTHCAVVTFLCCASADYQTQSLPTVVTNLSPFKRQQKLNEGFSLHEAVHACTIYIVNFDYLAPLLQPGLSQFESVHSRSLLPLMWRHRRQCWKLTSNCMACRVAVAAYRLRRSLDCNLGTSDCVDIENRSSHSSHGQATSIVCRDGCYLIRRLQDQVSSTCKSG